MGWKLSWSQILKAISIPTRGRGHAHRSMEKIKEENMWSSKDWTIKVDADAVFLPMRLREKLSTVEVTGNGIYLENCKYVKFGFFGNLEVFSRQAFSTLLANIDDCKSSLNYMGSEEDYGKEP